MKNLGSEQQDGYHSIKNSGPEKQNSHITLKNLGPKLQQNGYNFVKNSGSEQNGYDPPKNLGPEHQHSYHFLKNSGSEQQNGYNSLKNSEPEHDNGYYSPQNLEQQSDYSSLKNLGSELLDGYYSPQNLGLGQQVHYNTPKNLVSEQHVNYYSPKRRRLIKSREGLAYFPLEKLPVEIIQYIFRLVDRETCLKLRLVCYSFETLVGNLTRWMDEFPFFETPPLSDLNHFGSFLYYRQLYWGKRPSYFVEPLYFTLDFFPTLQIQKTSKGTWKFEEIPNYYFLLNLIYIEESFFTRVIPEELGFVVVTKVNGDPYDSFCEYDDYFYSDLNKTKELMDGVYEKSLEFYSVLDRQGVVQYYVNFSSRKDYSWRDFFKASVFKLVKIA
jgi:hypothetical protein